MSIPARLSVLLALLAAAIVPLQSTATAVGAGHLDPSFANHGKFVRAVRTGSNPQSSTSHGEDGAVVVHALSNGEFLVGDWADRPGSRDFAILKFQAGGTLDKHFGGGDGIVYTDFHQGLDYPDGIATDSKGRIIVGGCVGPTKNAGCDAYGLARYTSTGKLDTTFGSHGKVTTTFKNSNDATANGMAILPNGDIALGGAVAGPSNGPFTFGIAVYHPNGTLDKHFNGTGKVSGKGPSGAGASGIVATPDGKLTLVGSIGGDILLERYLPNGKLDPKFGTNGVEMGDFGHSENGYALVANASDAVTVAGYSTSSSTKFLIARFKPNGHIDGSFGTNGATVTAFGGAHNASANAMTVAPGGKFILAGQMLVSGSNYDMAFARYKANGKIDSTFGSGGKAVVSFGKSYDYAYGVAVLKDGDIVGAGQKGNHTAVAALVG